MSETAHGVIEYLQLLAAWSLVWLRCGLQLSKLFEPRVDIACITEFRDSSVASQVSALLCTSSAFAIKASSVPVHLAKAQSLATEKVVANPCAP